MTQATQPCLSDDATQRTETLMNTIATSRTKLLAAAVVFCCAVPGQAAVRTHTLSANATSRCQGALPAFETAIRKRPLAIQNEGTAAAFVTCVFDMEFPEYADPVSNETMSVGIPGSYGLSAWYSNLSAGPIELTCSAVSGFESGENIYVSKTITLESGAQGQLFWDEVTDFPIGFGGLIATSCNLPPGTAVNDTYISWSEDDGSTP